MSRCLIIVGALFLVITPIALSLAGSNSAATPQTAPPAEMLTVGETYTFGLGSSELRMEVLQPPHQGWVQVAAREEGFDEKTPIWVNLQQVIFITTKNFQDDESCATCQPETVTGSPDMKPFRVHGGIR